MLMRYVCIVVSLGVGAVGVTVGRCRRAEEDGGKEAGRTREGEEEDAMSVRE